ncbi:MAG TPA: gliding motility-associated C-terminal domain-containing protein [Puia sp.]|nr:gliding motility-associated C-terminal domain-containing protein [Puia sp.]
MSKSCPIFLQVALKIMAMTLLLFLGCIPAGKAQLCTGSLGDPVVNITFGAGGNPGPQLKTAATGYVYATDRCPQDGTYTLVNSSSNCFPPSWHTVSSDHTGNPGGYFMLVNASFQPSDFYLDTVRNLCGGTTYEFAAWVLNMMQPSQNCPNNGIRPNITFSIETTKGVSLGNYTTGDIGVTSFTVWNQYGLYFTTPPDVSDIVLRMTNNAPGGCGNDLGLDDITFRPCGPAVSAEINGAGGADLISMCQDDLSVHDFSATVSAGFNAPAYQWQLSMDSGAAWTDIPGETSTTFSRRPTSPGMYEYRLTVGASANIGLPACRVSSNILKILVNAKPVAAFTIDNAALLCSNQAVTIRDASSLVFGKISELDIYWDYQRDPTAKTADDSAFPGKLFPHNYPAFTSPATLTYQIQYVVYSSPGCLSETSQTITLRSSPTVEFDALAPVCEEVGPFGITQARQTSGFEGSGGYSGNGITPEGLFDPRAAGPGMDTLHYTFTASNGCPATANQTILVHPQPKPETGPDTYVLEGSSVRLGSTVAAGNDISYLWTPDSAIDDIHIPAPTVSPKEDITYQLKVVSSFGCSDSASVHVIVLKLPVVPNAFTPNGDGVNDVWVIRYLDQYPAAQVTVFNRYGQPVYRSSGFYVPWDGRRNGQALPVATYYWIINPGNGRKQMNGSVTIIR